MTSLPRQNAQPAAGDTPPNYDGIVVKAEPVEHASSLIPLDAALPYGVVDLTSIFDEEIGVAWDALFAKDDKYDTSTASERVIDTVNLPPPPPNTPLGGWDINHVPSHIKGINSIIKFEP